MKRPSTPPDCLYSFQKNLLTFLLLLSFSISASSQQYEVVWADEFDGTTVDLTKWTFQTGDGTSVGLPPGWGNNELQYYRTENATVAGGLLTITAKQESFNGYSYTSSRMHSLGKGDWTYGRIEMRAKLPVGQGLWPAFWMLSSDPSIYGGWAASGEIDIMEYLGQNPSRVLGTIHYGAPWPGNVFSSSEYNLPSGTFHDAFHVFAVEWEYDEIRWYVDDILYATKNSWFSTGGPYPAPFDADFHLLLNLAVGGNLPGSPDASTVFPQEYVVDYVRVLQKPNNMPTVTISSPAQGEDFSAGDSITITAVVTDDSPVNKVEFFQGAAKLGEDETSPYELTIPDVYPGCYTLIAKVTDDGGLQGVSEPVSISVGPGCPQSPYLMKPAPLPGVVEAENFDNGSQDSAYNETDFVNTLGQFRLEEAVDIEKSTDAGFGYNIGDARSGEWLEYTIEVAEAGQYNIEVRVAGESDGAFRIEFDGVDKTGTITFPATGGAQQWTFVKINNITLEAGIQVMRLVMLSDGFKINKYNFVASTSSTPGKEIVFDNMEHGAPLSNGWFSFGGAVGGGGINFNTTVPPQHGGSFSLETGWGSGGTPGYFGGFGRTFVVDISGTSYFNMWINTDSLDGAGRRQHYVIELNLQEDDNGDNAITQADDDEFQFNLTVGPAGSGSQVTAGSGWQFISVPLSSFFDDNSYLFGGNGTLDPSAGNGLLVNVVIAIISNSGADVTFRTDYWTFTAPPEEPSVALFDDFEDGNTADWGFFGGNNAGGGGGPFSDRPVEGSFYLSTGWGGQGTSSAFYGGFYKNLADSDQLTLPEDPWINLWVLNQKSATADAYTLEVTIREDLDGNGYTPGQDDSFRLDTRYKKEDFDDRWTLLTAPLSSFMDLSAEGDGVFNGKLDETVVVISGVQGAAGSTVEVDLDQIIFTGEGPLARDTLAPSFTFCPAHIGPVVLERNMCNVTVTWETPVATDDLSTFTITQIAGPPSGTAFKPGTVTTVTYKAEDIWGNTSVCSFNVTIAPGGLVVDAGDNKTLYSGYKPAEFVILCAKASGGKGQYMYDWGKGLSPHGFLLASPEQSTTYHVTVTDANGCTARDSVKVCVASIKCGKNKVLVCHQGRTLCIPAWGATAHLWHGDRLGACGEVYDCGFSEPDTESFTEAREAMLQVYPNPFKDKVVFRFSVDEHSPVVLRIIDKFGQQVALLADETKEGMQEHQVKWEPAGMPDGIYYYNLQIGERLYRGKVVQGK